MNIGLTGSSGVLGKLLLDKCLRDGFQVACFKGDIRNRTEVKEWLSGSKMDVVIHFAALVAVDQVESNYVKAFDVNVGGTTNLMSAIAESENRPWIFYASTSHVYKSSSSALKETDETEPINTYGTTKYMGELIVNSFAAKFKLKACIGRVFSFYHQSQKKPFLFPSIKERLSTEDLEKEFFLHGAESIRDLSPAEEIIEWIYKLMNTQSTGLYNIGSGSGIKIKDFVQRQTTVPLKIATNTQAQDNILVADITKLKSVLG